MNPKSVSFHEFGSPSEQLTVGEAAQKTLNNGQVRVAMQFAPINPADINFIQGTYGVKPELPTSPGVEGCGVVTESSDNSIHVGDQVMFIDRVGTWQQEIVCDAHQIYVVPRNLNVAAEQIAMLKVNPLTALRLIEGYADLTAGDFIIFNAANSGVGQCLIQLAKQFGLSTISLVRREELIDPLIALGADHVLIDDSSVVEKVRTICGENLPKLACNAVGGDSALRLMDALAENGHHVTYGAMSLRSIKVPNKFLIFKQVTLHGLWVTKWISSSDSQTVTTAYDRLSHWVAAGQLIQPIETFYQIDQINVAVEHATQSGRKGKILLAF